MRQLKIGDVIPAGTLVLVTAGRYSSFGITGLFRATADTTVPGRARHDGQPEVDLTALSIVLKEEDYVEAWADD